MLPDSDIKLQFKTEVIHSKGKMVGVEFERIDTATMNQMIRLMEGRTSNPEQVAREVALLHSLNQTI